MKKFLKINVDKYLKNIFKIILLIIFIISLPFTYAFICGFLVG
jgi:hypothetical protein